MNDKLKMALIKRIEELERVNKHQSLMILDLDNRLHNLEIRLK
jgi:hypothetical protein